MHGITESKQMAVYAYITRIKKSGKQIKIAFKTPIFTEKLLIRMPTGMNLFLSI